MDQLDAIGIDDAEHGRRGQEGLRPGLMGLQKTKEPGALRASGGTRADSRASTSDRRAGCPRLSAHATAPR
jgi:hypothetical protein